MSKKKPKFIRRNAGPRRNAPGIGYAVPFFLAMAILTVVSFIIPLRPTVSYIEKRSLAEFPEFSVESLTSGDYFDDISTWFSDTFPGRESWLSLATYTKSLHGHSEIMIEGDLENFETVPEIPEVTDPTEGTTPDVTDATEATEATEVTEPEETLVLEDVTAPTGSVEEWGGVDAGQNEVFKSGTVIQIGDSLFQQQGFSQYQSDRYVKIVSSAADKYEEQGVRVVSALPPQAVGVMIEPEYLKKIKCADQQEVLDYINANMSEAVITVDTVSMLRQHNDEYIYFRTDHHWTALAAYYTYEAICDALGMEAAPLDSYEEWDQGRYQGSLYWKAPRTSALKEDIVYAYKPAGEITTRIYKTEGSGFEWPLLTDMSKKNANSKYMVFLAGDHPMVKITNDSLPDAPNCVIIKDSFGNCLAPFFTQNYHTVYVVDYRYHSKSLSSLVKSLEIDDVIFVPNLGATQSDAVNDLLNKYKS